MVSIPGRETNRISSGFDFFLVFNTVFMILLAIIMIYPFLFILNLSLSTPEGATLGGAFLTPRGFTLKGYEQIIESKYLWTAFFNSVFVTVVGTTASVLVTAFAAYSLSKSFLPGKSLFTFLITFTMLFSGGLIPTYLVTISLGLRNTRAALILPKLVSAFNLIIIRNFFQNLPEDLEDAARIDGAGVLRIFFQLIFPLSMPAIATISLWYAVGYWNDFFQCLIYMQDRSKMVLQLVLREVVMMSNLGEYIADSSEEVSQIPESLQAATVMFATVPVLLIYPFIQKYFVKGILIGSLKG